MGSTADRDDPSSLAQDVGAPRVCPRLDPAAYPALRVAAVGVVLNDRREVLLVQCQQHVPIGCWHLPMGFLQAGESIADAARRGLREQTGLDAEVLKALDNERMQIGEYGDVLFVTVEMRKLGGNERPGNSVAELGYYPLSRMPELAITANERALRICAEGHFQEWMIRDSYERLESTEGKAMLSDAMVSLVRAHSEEAAQAWRREVLDSPTTASYREVDQAELLDRVVTVLSQFGRWLSGDEAEKDLTHFYFELGRKRREQGLAAHEVISALLLLKKHVWLTAGAQSSWERPIDAYRALELSRRINTFFDKATFHIVRGFES